MALPWRFEAKGASSAASRDTARATSVSSPRIPTALLPDSSLHRTQTGMYGRLEAWKMASPVYVNDGRKSYRAVTVLLGPWVETWLQRMMMGARYRISTMQVVAKRTAQILVQVLAPPDLGPTLT